MRKSAVRNLLVGAGALLLSLWVEGPALLAFSPISNRLVFTGPFEGIVLMPIVLALPSALVLAAAGALVAWLVESPRPALWALFPAVAYGVLSALSPSWVREPVTASDRVHLLLREWFPAVACIAGAVLSARLRGLRAAMHPGAGD